jgi:hypothetical protein
MVESKTNAGKVPQRHLVNELESKRFRRRNERKPRSRLFVVFFETSTCAGAQSEERKREK